MKALKLLRVYAFLEGISFLILLLVAMPMKHVYGMPLAVRIVGSAHGLLFLLFLSGLYSAAQERGWPLKRSALALLAALVPAGTFVLDRQLKRELLTLENGGGG